MPNEQNIQLITEYIAQNRAAHSLDALRAQLAAAGYSAEDVEAAIARAEQPQPPAPLPPSAPPAAPASAAPPPESGEQIIQRMVAYIEQNRQQYTLEALRQQLLSQSERPDLVDAALARVGAPPQRAGLLRPALPWAAGALVLSLVAAGLIAAQDGGFNNFDGLSLLIWGLLAAVIDAVLGLVLLVAGAVVMLANRRQRGLAIVFGGLFSLALSAIVVVLGFGVCLVLISQY